MASNTYATGGVVAAIAAAASAATAWVTARANRAKVGSDSRKVDAEAEGVVVATAERVVQMLSAQLSRADSEHLSCRAEIEAMKAERIKDRARISRLERALRDNGIDIPQETT